MYSEGGSAYLGRLLAAMFWRGVFGAACGAIWAAALHGSASFGALCGGSGSVALALVFSPAYAGHRNTAAGFAGFFSSLYILIFIIGLIVWIVRAVTS